MADNLLGNTQEQISAYEEIYDYSRVGNDFMKEAQRWFGCLVKPPSDTSEYYYWRKWNDPNLKQYWVKKGKKIIVDKRTGELAISPSFRGNVRLRQYQKGMTIFEKLKILYAEDVVDVVGMGALALEDSDEEDEDEDDEDDEDEEGDEKDEDDEVRDATVAMASVRVE